MLIWWRGGEVLKVLQGPPCPVLAGGFGLVRGIRCDLPRALGEGGGSAAAGRLLPAN